MRSLVLVALVALAAGCTSGGSPLAPEERTTTVAENFAPVPEGMSRLVFLRSRESVLYVARSAPIYWGEEKLGSTVYGRYFHRDLPAGEHRLHIRNWDTPGRCEVVVDVRAGQTYYFMVDPREAGFGAFVAGDAAAMLLGQEMWVALAGGMAAMAAESYANDCGGLFRLYPVDETTATRLLVDLEPGKS